MAIQRQLSSIFIFDEDVAEAIGLLAQVLVAGPAQPGPGDLQAKRDRQEKVDDVLTLLDLDRRKAKGLVDPSEGFF